MVAKEMQSGCALLTQINLEYGENNASEAVQAHRIVKQLPASSIVMADANFGIYSVAHHSTKADHDFLFRLTEFRHYSNDLFNRLRTFHANELLIQSIVEIRQSIGVQP